VMGGYDPVSGMRDLTSFETIIDGTNLGTFLLVKYDTDCTNPTTIDGLTFQNSSAGVEGGCGFLRANITVSHCIIRNCETTSSAGAFYNNGGTITDCTIELCSAGSSGGAIYQKSGLTRNCIVRGNQGKYAAIRVNGGRVENCVIYNNSATVSGWPNSGGIYNPGGTVVNCIIANNWGEGYAGIHSEGYVINTIAWGNQTEDGFADPENYIASNQGTNNACDHGFPSSSFSLTLGEQNMAANGPQFVNPTSFKGIPTNAAEIAAMRAADFRLAPQSPCIDAGAATGATDADINGTVRPQGSGVDMGAYEYNPDAQTVYPQSVTITQDTIFVVQGETVCPTAIVLPADATDKSITWGLGSTGVATIEGGCITGVEIGTTTVTAVTNAGGHTATAVVVVVEPEVIIIHPEVLAADSLYPITNYTVPSFIPFWAAKEAARADSTEENLQAMRDAVLTLVDYRMPYDICCNINGDPSCRMAFNWFTNEGVSDGEVQIVLGNAADEAAFANATAIQAVTTVTKPLRYAVSTSGVLKATGMSNKQTFTYVAHKAIAENLTPGQQYSYRVGYNGYWSPIGHFQTSNASTDAFKFVVMSDSHIMDEEYVQNARWCADATAQHAADAKFCFFPGDFVETGTEANSEWEWEQWFNEAMLPMLQAMPLAPTDGNHDDSNNLNYSYHFNTDNEFNTVARVKPQFDGITYSFVYGDALFMVYSHQDYWRGSYSYSAGTSSYLTNDVAPWFREQVRRHPNTKWRIAIVHKNLFCGSGHQADEDGALFRATLLPVFKELHIDLALQGHDHTYEVIGPVDSDTKQVVPGSVTNQQTVTVNSSTNMTGKKGGQFTVDDGTLYYVGATCGRKRYYPYTRAEMEANEAATGVANYFDLFTGRFGQPGMPTYTEVSVSTERIQIEAYTADTEGNSTLFDSFTVVKNTTNTGFDRVQEINNENQETARKYFIDGQLFIARNGCVYNATGIRVE